MTPHQELRAATAPAHERVDRAFGHFDLGDRQDYARFLIAHARAAAAVEAAIDAAGFAAMLDDWPERRRVGLIRADLAAVGRDMPEPLPFALGDTPGAVWGAAYVLEGSRLGGAMLARSVPENLPKDYLARALFKGAWRKFLAALDDNLYLAEMRREAIGSAQAVFTLFETSASRVEAA